MPKAAAKEKAPAKASKAAKKAPKEKKEKKAKDPNAPKRPMGAYFLFSNDMRAKVSIGCLWSLTGDSL
jgi:membrane protein involved in colicin uptake